MNIIIDWDRGTGSLSHFEVQSGTRGQVHCPITVSSILPVRSYYDGKVVGWCNANTKADCLKCYCWRRFMSAVPTKELVSGIRVKSIFCFLVAPEFRRKGITKLLLERVCQDATDDGFDFIEAYPLKEYINEAKDFMGPVELFKKNGFTVHGETEDKLVMRKSLK